MTDSETALPFDQEMLASVPKSLKGEGVPSAVLVGATMREGRWHVLMTERSRHLANHAGQISFPGGKVEAGDASLVHTALRETHEEIAVSPEEVRVLGALDVVASPSGFVVLPIVGIVDAGARPEANPDEVDRVLVLPLAPLLDPAARRRTSYTRQGRRRRVWAIDHEEHCIWGLSAAVLVDLARRAFK